LLDLASQSYSDLSGISLVIVEGPERFVIRQLEEGELDAALVTTEVGVKPRLVAKDALAIVVHPSNPVEALSLTELRSLYVGYTLDWDNLGGRGEVVLISRGDGSAAQAVFEEKVIRGGRISPTAVVMPSSKDVVGYVSLHPGAIGYVAAGYLKGDVKALSLEGHKPTPSAVNSGEYPLLLPAYAVTLSKEGEKLVEFLTGPVGRSIIGSRYALP